MTMDAYALQTKGTASTDTTLRRWGRGGERSTNAAALFTLGALPTAGTLSCLGRCSPGGPARIGLSPPSLALPQLAVALSHSLYGANTYRMGSVKCQVCRYLGSSS